MACRTSFHPTTHDRRPQHISIEDEFPAAHVRHKSLTDPRWVGKTICTGNFDHCACSLLLGNVYASMGFGRSQKLMMCRMGSPQRSNSIREKNCQIVLEQVIMALFCHAYMSGPVQVLRTYVAQPLPVAILANPDGFHFHGHRSLAVSSGKARP